MKKMLYFVVIFLVARGGYGAADFEVERVNSPYVESKDVGPMMQSENTHTMMKKTSAPFRSYSTYGRQGSGCLTCQHGIGGASTGSNSYSSSSYSQEGMEANPVYRHPEASSWSSWSSWSSMPSSSNSGSKYYSSGSEYNMMPTNSHQQSQSQYQESSQRQTGYDEDNDFDDELDNEFEREIRRMREELERQTLSGSHSTHLSSPVSGGSHRSEFRKETKYVNGKPIYMLNEEKKYKDGKLIHNVRDEKGPDDLGTRDTLSSSPVLTYPTGEVYSRQNEEIYRSQSHQPTERYPSYRPSSHISSSESRYSSSNQQPYYRPSSVYSSESVHEQTNTQSHGNYYPNSYNPKDQHEREDVDEHYRQSHNRASHDSLYYRPETTASPTTTTTTTTTQRPSYVGYDSAPIYSRPGYNQRPASSHKFEEQSSSTYYSNSGPTETSGRPSYSSEQPNYRPYARNPDTDDKIREASQSSYYELTANRNRPANEDHEQFPRYRTGVFSTSEARESEISHQTPVQQNRITETSRSYRPGTHVTSTTQEEHTKSVSSSQYPTHTAQRPSYERNRPDDRDSSSVGSSHPNYGVPGFISGPESDHTNASEEEEEERYDISPYDDATDVNNVEDETETNTVQFENHPMQRPKYRPSGLPEPDRLIGNNQQGYSTFNSSRTDHITKVLPSRWVETKTTWKYMNGRLVSETQHHRYYENGILIHENSTRRTRDEMEADGINVFSLDLTASQLSEYGPAIASTSHSQKHEMHEIKRFRNGQQIYELSHEKRFQDGNLVHDNRIEKDEDDFGVSSPNVDNYQQNQAHNFNRHSLAHESGLYSTAGALQTADINPKAYSRKHELRQEEEFVNGQKIYDFHHEREYKDGRLIRENKTELGPKDLGSQTIEHRDALKDILSGHTQSSVAHKSLLEQQRTADSLLKTACVTCGTVHGSSVHGSALHGSSIHSKGNVLGSLGIPVTQRYNTAGGSSFRKDLNIEEHYEDGQLVKGREAQKKWQDGQLIDAKEEHYYDGPSRANISTNLVPGFSSSATMSAFSSAPMESDIHTSGNECASYNPCRNKGTCRESVRGPICICVFGFKGNYCEEAYCPSRYCRYGGSCSIDDNQHVCICRDEYSGYRCSSRRQSLRIGVSG